MSFQFQALYLKIFRVLLKTPNNVNQKYLRYS